MHSQNIRYIPAIDQLRALSALFILAYHGLHIFGYQLRFNKPFEFSHWIQTNNPIYNFLVEGHASVGLFMVLSGFIFTTGSMSTGVRWLPFLRNRLLRIYPMLLLVILAGISTNISEFRFVDLLQTLIGLGNLPGVISGSPFTGTIWSVAVEWQFYMLFPILIVFVTRSERKTLVGMVLIIIIFRGLVTLNAPSQLAHYLTLLGRLDQIIIGMLLATVLRGREFTKRRGWLMLGGAAACMMAALHFHNLTGGWPADHWWRFLWPTAEALLWALFVAGYLTVAKSARNMITSTLIFIGERSYSLYLLHVAIICTLIKNNWIIELTGRPLLDAMVNTILVAAPLSIVLSCLTYEFIEKPFLSLRTPYLKQPEAPLPEK